VAQDVITITSRGNSDAPLHDRDVRRALNWAIDRQAVVEQGLAGYASVIPALTPPWCSGFPPGATPFEFDPGKAREAFAGASWPARRPLRIATPEPFAGIAHILAAGIRSTLDVLVEVICAPQALYAVNEHVTFSPYETAFELAEVTVGGRHWSVSGDGAVLGARTGRPAPRRTWTSPTLGGDDRRPERRPPPAGAAHRHAAGRSAPRRGREPARSRAGQGRRADRAGAGPRR
jgi:hypothetical protein